MQCTNSELTQGRKGGLSSKSLQGEWTNKRLQLWQRMSCNSYKEGQRWGWGFFGKWEHLRETMYNGDFRKSPRCPKTWASLVSSTHWSPPSLKQEAKTKEELWTVWQRPQGAAHCRKQQPVAWERLFLFLSPSPSFCLLRSQCSMTSLWKHWLSTG